MRAVERESLSFFFWALPFDSWAWALVLVSLVGLSVVSKGAWLDVFGALIVRQSYSTLNKNKSLILLLFAAIVLRKHHFQSSHGPTSHRCGTDSQGPRRLGYGIIGYDSYSESESIFLLLRRENISHSSVNEPPFIPNTSSSIPNQRMRMLLNCNVTTFESNSVDASFMEQIMNYSGLGIRCHSVKETRLASEHLITYSGYFPRTVQNFLSSFQESGILDMLYDFQKYDYPLPGRILMAMEDVVEEKAEVPFELRDPKILSIFIAWGGLLVGASLVFLVESLLGLLIFLSFIASELTNLRLHLIL